MKAKYFLTMLVILLLSTNLAYAKLNEEQLNEAALKVQNKCPEWDLNSIKIAVKEADCGTNIINFGGGKFNCSSGEHEYLCSQGIHYLDGEVISILSSKTDIHNTQITDSNIMNNVDIKDSKVTQSLDNSKNNWFFNLFLDINFYLGITFTIGISLILKFFLKLKIVKKKK